MTRARRACIVACFVVVFVPVARDLEAARFYPSYVFGIDGTYLLHTTYRLTPGDPPSASDTCFEVVGDLGSGPRFEIIGLYSVPNPVCVLTFFATSMQLVTTYGPGTHTVTFIATNRVTGAELARQSLTVTVYPPPPPRTLRLRAALEADAPGPSAGVTLPAEARVPLGAMVRFEAIEGSSGEVLASEFVLGTATLDAGVAADALFPDKVLLAYGTSGAFQAVHRGRVTIEVRPADPAIPPGAITVIVEDPEALGTTFTYLDPLFYAVGHQLGVPPHFIKAHAHKESRFNRFAYRYEPIGPSVGDLAAISRGRNLRTKTPYADYRLATARDSLNDALPDGARLTPADRDVRAGLLVECDASGQNGRPIQPTDTLVSAWEIFRCNDARMNWATAAGTAANGRVAQLQSDPFTAQTGLAASYGLLQMSYVTAIDEMEWRGTPTGARNPSLLFDAPENIARSGGSLGIGIAKIATGFRRRHPEVAGGVQTLSSHAELLLLFVDAWGTYNRLEVGYAEFVLGFVPSYAPIAKVSVWGGGQ